MEMYQSKIGRGGSCKGGSVIGYRDRQAVRTHEVHAFIHMCVNGSGCIVEWGR